MMYPTKKHEANENRLSRKKIVRDISVSLGILVLLAASYYFQDFPTDSDSQISGPDVLTTSSEHAESQNVTELFITLSQWDVDKIESLLVEPTKSTLPLRDLHEVVATLDDSLGELRSHTEPVRVEVDAPDSPQYLSVYRFTAIYEKGTATVTLHVLQDNRQFGLLAFNIESDVIAPQAG